MTRLILGGLEAGETEDSELLDVIAMRISSIVYDFLSDIRGREDVERQEKAIRFSVGADGQTRLDDGWPEFVLNVPCPGFDAPNDKTGKREWSYCHESWSRREVECRYGELCIVVTLCPCVGRNKGWSEAVSEALETHYGPVSNPSSERCFVSRKDKAFAAVFKAGPRWNFYWDICKCGKPSVDDKTGFWNAWSEFGAPSPYCSIECLAEGEELRCGFCGKSLAGVLTDDKWDSFWKRMMTLRGGTIRDIERRYYRHRPVDEPIGVMRLYDIQFGYVCSDRCLADRRKWMQDYREQILATEREKKCVRHLGKLMKSVRKAMRSQDLEALSTLSEEFEQVRISPE